VFLSRNFDQSMLKNVYFLEKSVKIASASGDPPPNHRLLVVAESFALRSPRSYSRLLLQLCQVCFLVLNAYYSSSLKKEQKE